MAKSKGKLRYEDLLNAPLTETQRVYVMQSKSGKLGSYKNPYEREVQEILKQYPR